jgi:hypothetical protein
MTYVAVAIGAFVTGGLVGAYINSRDRWTDWRAWLRLKFRRWE